MSDSSSTTVQSMLLWFSHLKRFHVYRKVSQLLITIVGGTLTDPRDVLKLSNGKQTSIFFPEMLHQNVLVTDRATGIDGDGEDF